jgi:hypothetical protein
LKDPAREGLRRLMAEIDDLEESAEVLQRKLGDATGIASSPHADAAGRELLELLERLEQKRSELTRISNACRRPHSNV